MALPAVLPGPLAAFGSRFFPPGLDAPTRSGLTGRVLSDAATGGLAALVLGATALLVLRGVLRPSRGTALAVAIVAADLLRAGAGLNPMVSASFFRPSPELASALPRLREGRVFTCSLEESSTYRAARAARGSDHELWSFATLQETLTPFANLRLGVPTALSPDLTMLVSEQRVLSPDEASCRDLDRILPRLQDAGVRWVLSVSPLDHPDLVPESTLQPARAMPLEVRVYATRRPRPWLEVDSPAPAPGAPRGRVIEASRSVGRIVAVVETGGPAALAVGEGWAPGWSATIDERPVAVARTPQGRMSLPLPGGRSRVVLRFRPRGWFPGLLIGALGTAVTTALLRRRPRRPCEV
jgi:hypothetical protein